MIITIVLQVVLGVLFTGLGFSKITGVKMQVDEFDRLKLPQWFRIVTGIVQLIGTIALVVGIWLPEWAAFGGLWIAVTMFFAAVAHIRVKHPVRDTIPASVLMILALIVFFLNSSALIKLFS
ncbi:DoxX family protein [Planococcus donghaensis MPA1U2]|uniref:DoxX family protein n=1 Tax=Planococcus donghaensis MPA1U2 TaxID=933115 RepID=E7RDE3_9BACL|nr:DoxX family protein [Planococcus donghaensis]EGA90947.1 DoxX family protein [Planococcus donghaensis MPA1U2]